MRKIMIVLFLVILLSFLAGCQQKPTQTGATPFLGGTKALDIKFMDNSPPAEVFDAPDPSKQDTFYPFNIILRIENIGEADIAESAMKIRLSGLYVGDFNKRTGYQQTFTTLNPADLTLTYSEQLLERTRKDSEGNKLPGEIWLTEGNLGFPELAYAKKLAGSITIPLRADISYMYTNEALVMYCLRRNLMSRMSGICEVTGTKTVYNSAGPVHILAATESIAGSKKVLFTFKVKNVGSGRIIKYGAIDYFSEVLSDQNKVFITVDPKVSASAGLESIFSCSNLDKTSRKANEGYLSLGETGEGIFTCTLDTTQLDTEAVKEMGITLNYIYLESIHKTVTVKHMIS